MMTYKTTDDLIAQAVSYATWSLTHNGQLNPAFFLIPDAGPAVAFFHTKGDFDEDDKDKFVQMARMFTVAHNASAICLVAEMWVHAPTLTSDEMKQVSARGVARTVGLPSEQFDKEEIVGLWTQTREHGHKFESRKIVRWDNRKFSGLAASDLPVMDESKGDHVEGRFCHLLPHHNPPTQVVRDMARTWLALQGIKVAGAVPDPIKE